MLLLDVYTPTAMLECSYIYIIRTHVLEHHAFALPCSRMLSFHLVDVSHVHPQEVVILVVCLQFVDLSIVAISRVHPTGSRINKR